MADIPALKAKLKTQEQKLVDFKSGKKTSIYLEGGEDRQEETIARTELFIRQLKEAIATEEQSPVMPSGADIHKAKGAK